MTDMNRRNLRKRRGGSYAVVYYVPAEFREKVGKREIVRGLGTSDEAEAMRLKAAMLLEITAEVHRLVARPDVEARQTPSGETIRHYPEKRITRRTRGPATGAVVSENPKFVRLRGSWKSNSYVVHKKEGLIAKNGVAVERERSGADLSRTTGVRKTARGVTISRAAEEWQNEWSGITPNTRVKYMRTLRGFAEFFEDRSIREITRRDAVAYFRHLRDVPSERTGKPMAPKTVANEITSLISFFEASRRLGLLPWEQENPFKKVAARLPGQKKTEAGTKNLRAVTRTEAERYVAAVRAKPRRYSFEMEALIRLLWVTGARASDVASLTRDQIHDDGDLVWLEVRKAKTKAGERWLCLVGRPEQELVRDALRRADRALSEEEIPEENRDLLFPRLRRGSADQKPYHYVGRSLEDVRKQTFGKDVPWDMHSFRRNAAAALSNASVPENARKLVLGHSTRGDIGFDVYARKGDLWKLIENTMRALYNELGGGL